jgi:NitT/TauT family transport system permease protein
MAARPEASVMRLRSAPRDRQWKLVWILRSLVVLLFLVAWQRVPDIPGVRSVFTFADPFFISSPTGVARELVNLATGHAGATPIWGPLLQTLLTSVAGALLALAVGVVAGVAVSNWAGLERISRPFIVLFNAVPRVAVIPLIVLLFKSSNEADVAAAFSVVVFLVFYQALEGASTVPREMIQNAELLGAMPSRVMWRVRTPFALAWTFSALPNVIAHAVTGTITAELFTGGAGLGHQMILGIDESNAPLLFSVVLITAVTGVILVLGAAALRRRLLPWWDSSAGK